MWIEFRVIPKEDFWNDALFSSFCDCIHEHLWKKERLSGFIDENCVTIILSLKLPVFLDCSSYQCHNVQAVCAQTHSLLQMPHNSLDFSQDIGHGGLLWSSNKVSQSHLDPLQAHKSHSSV